MGFRLKIPAVFGNEMFENPLSRNLNSKTCKFEVLTKNAFKSRKWFWNTFMKWSKKEAKKYPNCFHIQKWSKSHKTIVSPWNVSFPNLKNVTLNCSALKKEGGTSEQKQHLKPLEKTFLSVLSNFPMQNQLDTENETKCVNRVDRKMKRGLQHFIVCFSFMLKNDYRIFFFFYTYEKTANKNDHK